MKNYQKIILTSLVFFGVYGIASAAPGWIYQRTILPETDQAFDLGTTTQQWRDIYTKNITVTGTCTGCGSSAAFPFTPTTNYNVAVNSTSTPIWFTAGLMASSTSYFPGSGIWNSSGNVGIGTTTPVTQLDIENMSATSTLRLFGANTYGAKLSLYENANAGSGLGGFGFDIFYDGTANVLSFTTVENGTPTLQALTLRRSNGNVGIGTTSPGQMLSVAGDILGNNIIGSYFTSTSTTASTFAGAITSTATSKNTFPYASTTALTVSGNAYFPGSGIWNSSGNVGIGTTTLDIAGTALDTLVIGKAADVNAGVVLDLGAAGTGAYGFAIDGTINGRISYSAASKAMSFLANSLTANMTLASSGNVGIGITAPENTLQISTTSAGIVTNGLLLQNRSSTIGTGVSLNFISSATSFSDNRYNSITSVNTDGSNGQALTFSTSNSAPQVERLRITAAGNVGIGITTPGALLSLGTAVTTIKVAAYDGGGSQMYGMGVNSGQLTFGAGIAVSGTPQMVLTSTGLVGIGTTSPVGTLSVAGTIYSNNLLVQGDYSNAYIRPQNAGSSLYLGAAGSNYLTVQPDGDFIVNSGNVGIGTTSPWGKLSVTGAGTGTGVTFAAANSSNSPLFTVLDNGTVGVGTGITYTSSDYGMLISRSLEASTTPNFTSMTAGSAQGEISDMAMYSTFVGTGDSGPRRTADIVAGFNGGAWGNEYLAFGVGFNSSPNDGRRRTTEKMRITAAGNVGIGTTTPGSLLSVAGGAYLSGFYNTSQTTGGYKMNGSVVLTASSTSGLTLGGIGAGSALSATTTLNGNTIFGFNAANVSTSTSQTTAIGYRALASLNDCRNSGAGASGCLLTAVGHNALAANTIGYWNTAIGASALAANTTGIQNIGLGAGTLVLNTTGSGNVAIGGTNTLSSNVSGSSNVAVGQQSLQSNTNSNNTGVGTYAGYHNTSGSVNTFIGEQAGMGNVSVTNNSNSVIDTNMLFLGYRAAKDRYGLASTSVMTNSAAIGANSVVGASNSIVLGGLGSNAVSVGIGSSTPFAKLSLHAYNGETNANLFAIASSTASATTTHFSVRNSGAIYAPNTTSSGSAQTGYWCYDANGQFVRTSTTCLVSASRFKERVGDLDVGLAELMKLRPVSYFLKDTMGDPNNADQQIGFIAEEAQAVDARLVTRNSEGQVQSFRYEQFTALLTKAIQEQQRQIENLKVGVVEIKRSVEEDWQNFFLLLLFAGLIFQQVQINKLRK